MKKGGKIGFLFLLGAAAAGMAVARRRRNANPEKGNPGLFGKKEKGDKKINKGDFHATLVHFQPTVVFKFEKN